MLFRKKLGAGSRPLHKCMSVSVGTGEKSVLIENRVDILASELALTNFMPSRRSFVEPIQSTK